MPLFYCFDNAIAYTFTCPQFSPDLMRLSWVWVMPNLLAIIESRVFVNSTVF